MRQKKTRAGEKLRRDEIEPDRGLRTRGSILLFEALSEVGSVAKGRELMRKPRRAGYHVTIIVSIWLETRNDPPAQKTADISSLTQEQDAKVCRD